MYRGSGAQFGNRYDRDDNRYDNFYRGGGAGGGAGSGRGGRSGAAGAGRDWEGSRDRSSFNRNDGNAGRRDDRGAGGHAAGMMAALQAQQTQNMLAALSQANNLRHTGGLLPAPGRYNDRDRRGGGRGGGDHRRGGAPRPGDKRRGEPTQGNYGKQRDRRPPPAKAAKSDKPKPKPKEDKKEKEEEVPLITEADIPDEDVEISDELMDKVETLPKERRLREM